MPKKKGAFKTRLEYYLFLSITGLIRITPAFFKKLQVKILVFFLKLVDHRHKLVMANNLRLAFPEKDEAELKELQSRIYRHFILILIETASVFRGRSPQPILTKSKVNGLPYLQNALTKGKGAILFTAHFGNWEWIPLLLHPQVQKPIYGVVRPLDNSLIEERLKRFREVCGSRIIYKQRSLRLILELLKKNEIVCILVDLNTVQREGVAIEFFSRKAYAVTTVPQLSLKLGIPILPIFVHYENSQIVMDILPEMIPAKTNDLETDIQALTQKMNTLIEEQVRRHPEQWFWFHDRWKTKPRGEEHAPRKPS